MHVRPILYALALSCSFASPSQAINILVDFTYDTNNFFPAGSPQRTALQAAADRFSQIITSPLNAVALADNSTDGRIGFTHPGTGASYEVSAAASTATDVLYAAGAAAASEYRGSLNIPADTWILYAGGRDMGAGGPAGVGGTGTGTNFTTVFSTSASHINRGFNPGGNSSIPYYLPVWGGAVSFNSNAAIEWNYSPSSHGSLSQSDFYSVALHEIGHVLGLSAQNWKNFSDDTGGTAQFSGANAVAALNADNGSSLISLTLESNTNGHWKDGVHDSFIFEAGSPNYVGTVGPGVLQDLLMEPTANFTSAIRRFELTNVDVAALRDLGWTIIPEPTVGLLAVSALGLGLRRHRARPSA